MKSTGKAFMNRKAQQIAQKAAQEMIAQNYDLIRCEAFKQNCDDITRQAVAIMIFALSMHGYGEKRLKRIFEWFLEFLDFPEVFGKKLTTAVAEKKCEELGIDLNRINVEVEMIDK